MEEFDMMYDRMNTDALEHEKYLFDLYAKEGNSENVRYVAQLLIERLKTQEMFTEIYCKDDIKDVLLGNIQSKIDSVNLALENEKTR